MIKNKKILTEKEISEIPNNSPDWTIGEMDTHHILLYNDSGLTRLFEIINNSFVVTQWYDSENDLNFGD